MNFILDNLAIGNVEEAKSPPSEITALLCVADDQDLPDSPLVYHRVPVRDMKSITAPQLQEAVDWIAAHIDRHRIMVFCRGGVGRAPTVVVGYLCCALGYRFGDAVEHVATIKPRMSILPNLIERIAEVRAHLDERARAASVPRTVLPGQAS